MNRKDIKITKEEVARIASLARVQLTDQELEAATADLSGILSHFAAIQAINTEGVVTADDPTSSGLRGPDASGVTRQDIAKPEELATHQELLEAAPQTKDGQFKVKAIFAQTGGA